jgi:hypothetical protein
MAIRGVRRFPGIAVTAAVNRAANSKSSIPAIFSCCGIEVEGSREEWEKGDAEPAPRVGGWNPLIGSGGVPAWDVPCRGPEPLVSAAAHVDRRASAHGAQADNH